MKIDDEQYEAGRRAFFKGSTLRDVVERLNPPGDGKTRVYDAAEEDRKASFAIGFGDALLTYLRGVRVP